MKEIEGSFDPIADFVMDPKGYFLIRVNYEDKKIELGYCEKPNEIKVKIYGKIPQEIYMTAVKMGLLSRLDHAAYLGKELYKAYAALKLGKEYVQDSDISF